MAKKTLNNSLDKISALHQNAIKTAQADSSHKITAVHILKGELTLPDEESFRAIWSALSKNTALENSQLLITMIPAQAQCMICRKFYAPQNQKISCPHCGSVGAKIVSGEELRLDHMESK